MHSTQMFHALSRRLGRPFAVFTVLLGAATTGAGAQVVADVFDRVAASVVVVFTESTEYEFAGNAVAVSVQGIGSGVLVAPNQVMTAAHVVQAANRVAVAFPNGEEQMATVSASSETHDVALLTLDRPVQVPPVRLGNSDSVRVGDQVMVVGAPLGESHTLTVGHVSARRRRAGLLGTSRVEFLQTDASINQGNSGGPMFNMAGEVVGIVSHILSGTGGSVGLGYAVSSNTAEDVLIRNRAWWTGVSGAPITGPLAQMLNVPAPGGGVMVQHVARGSFGERLGVIPASLPVAIGGREVKLGGDIIIEIHGIPLGAELENSDRIRQALIDLPPSSIVRVKVLRAGQVIELVATTPSR